MKQKIFLNYPDFQSMKNMEKLNDFTSLMKTLPFKYQNIYPDEKYLLQNKNPPNVKIIFTKILKI